MASVSGSNKIVLKATYGEGGAQNEEGILDSAAYPGMNVVRTADPAVQGRHTWTPGSTDYAGTGTDTTTAKGPVRVLKEDALQGRTVNDAYDADGNCFVHIGLPGDVLQVLVLSGQTINKAAGLSANTAGKWVSDTTNAVVEALESSGGALGADTLLRVCVL